MVVVALSAAAEALASTVAALVVGQVAALVVRLVAALAVGPVVDLVVVREVVQEADCCDQLEGFASKYCRCGHQGVTWI